jgi:hypothetical protein
VFDFTPDEIARLTAAELWRLLRPLTFEAVRRGTTAQWFAALVVVLRDDPARLRSYGRHFTALFLTHDEQQKLRAQFDAEIAVLHAALKRGPERGETSRQLAERVAAEFEWLTLERYAGLWNGLRLPAPRGRRPKFRSTRPRHTANLPKSPSPSGGRPRFTPEQEKWLLDEIDRWRATLAEEGERVSDKKALQRSMVHSYVRRARDRRASRAEAKREAIAAVTGSLFRTRLSTLSRIRGRHQR